MRALRGGCDVRSLTGRRNAAPAAVAVPATVAVVALVEAVLVGGCAPAASLDGVFGNSAAVVVIAVAAADAGADAVAC